MDGTGKCVARYLEEHGDEILDGWMSKAIINDEDPYGGVVRSNGSMMLNLLIASATEGAVDSTELRALASNISRERLQANANISEFVYNVALGRTEILAQIPRIDIPIETLYPVFDMFNSLFDEFLHDAVHDYTELKDQRLEEQSSFIEQSHKDRLTILGQMSSSFVHEFRNPLTSIIGFVQLLTEKYPRLEYVDVLMKELTELNFRITQFLLVSKKGGNHNLKKWFGIGTVLHETIDFLYPVIVNSKVDVDVDVDESVCIFGYSDEFRQVLINLITNSLDALSSCTTKKLLVTGYLDGGAFVTAISNNGPAIPPDMMQAIFEPFVSTKKLGTGIGLYLCKKIILDHGGVIDCTSDEETTTFRIVMPPEHVKLGA